eukprot:TRINITY_DN90725_c0_g1_i1.p1 TRINITY_DN90725_c0_g1~~TRINITY_DN90725_c0_g1_i1.p1  ORF type:complete len:401 (-),score=112.73 TRINITY_DN90725_c0_g1_i1:136-1338(-)
MGSEGGIDGMVSYVVHGTKFEAKKQFTVLEPVGQGAYGVVCSARDEETKETMAIKKIENAFEHLTFAKRTLRELKLLRHLKHDNLLHMYSVYVPDEKGRFQDIYIVSELMETDLASVIKSPQPLSEDHSQFFFYQIVRGLKYIHSADVVHRDLKPRNLLVNSICDLKICDYGLARVCYPEDVFRMCPMTEYICTRWYRAPEVLTSLPNFGKPIDMWSVGCILAEMLRRKPLFPGKNTQHQLQLILGCLGTPSKAALLKIPNEKCKNFIESLPATAAKRLDEMVSGSPKGVADLLENTICFDPQDRLTCEKCLAHPYLAMLHCEEDEPFRTPLDCAEFEFERRKIDMAALREEIYIEALRYDEGLKKKYLAEQRRTGPYDINTYRLLAPGQSQYSSDDEDA